ncbi:MAG TPA: S8 family serine peptidase, partial [Ktedonobacterales bacterium]|nr:S8 family serine peptidase [Ktedonobacterales bacterium]
MSQRQRLPESEAAAALELLTLRSELADLTFSETRLKLRILELQSQITSLKTSTPRKGNARKADDDALASDYPERLADLQAQLADAQEQMTRLLAQQEALLSRQQAAQQRLNDLRASLQSGTTWHESTPPWEKTEAPIPKRTRAHRPLMAVLFGLLLVFVLGTLFHFVHVSSLGFSLLPNASSHSTRQPEAPPFFTPAKTAPTNQGCITTIKYGCYSPEYIQQALGLTQLYRQGFLGSGQTIVLIGAGNVTTLQADLHQFDIAWGLPPPNLNIIYPDGLPAPYTCPNGDSLQYTNILNVEWAHAIAPGANLVLLIGSNLVSNTQPEDNCTQASLQQDIAFALDHSLGSVISINPGSSELGSSADAAAQKAARQKYLAAGHQLLQRAASAHVTVVAAAGDSGATNLNDYPQANVYWPQENVSWPASDPDALAVGGTVLAQSDDYDSDAYSGETAWSSSDAGATGGGLSAIFAEPEYQQTISDQTLFQGKRGVPDVSFPATNMLVYNSGQDGALMKANPQWQHWDVAEGTSIAASSWAGLIALANQMHGQPLGLLQPALYRLHGQGMHDITS